MQNVPGGVEVPQTPELLNDFEQFKQRLRQRTGLDLSQYKFDQTYRRIWTMVERAGLQRFTDYLNHLLEDEQRLRTFIDRLAINVSELFRNPEQFESWAIPSAFLTPSKSATKTLTPSFIASLNRRCNDGETHPDYR